MKVKVAQPCPTLWPHGLRPVRLLCPWNSPGRNTGVGCPSLLRGIFLTQRSAQVSHTAGRFSTGWATHVNQSTPQGWGCSNSLLVIPPVCPLAHPSCTHTRIPRREGDFITTACSGFRWGWMQTQAGGVRADGHPAGAGLLPLSDPGDLSPLWHPSHTALIPHLALTAWCFSRVS